VHVKVAVGVQGVLPWHALAHDCVPAFQPMAGAVSRCPLPWVPPFTVVAL